MKIGFDAKRFFHNHTGLGNYSRDLVRVLYQNAPEHTYYLYNPKPTTQYAIHPANTSLKEVNPKGFWKKIKSLWRLFGIKSQITQDKLDIFHGLSGEIPLGLPAHQKKIVTIHDLIFVRYPHLYSFFDRKIHFYKFRYAARKADVVIAISEQTKQDIITYLKINPEKIKVVYQGCSNVFKENFSALMLEQVREKYNLPKEFVLNVGTIEPRKNALTIVKAIETLDTTLVLIGKPTAYFEEIQSYAKAHNLSHRVLRLQGVSQHELAMIYQLATVLVYPSIFEGFGIPIIEALFSKTPVITTGSGVFPEAAGPSSLYLDDPYDAKEMSEKIKMVISDASLQNKMAEEGVRYAQRFTDTTIAEHHLAIYKSLLS